jgi:hypothetical protein
MVRTVTRACRLDRGEGGTSVGVRERDAAPLSRTCRIPSLHTVGSHPSPATETRSDSRSIARAETHEHADRDEQRESWADDRTERSGVREECF